jgi:hypothetical protein
MIIVLLLAVVMELYAESQVGSAEIGRDTMKMYRQKRTGQTELLPRRVPSKAAPKRIFQEQEVPAEQPSETPAVPVPTEPAPIETTPTPAVIEPVIPAVETPKPDETAVPSATPPTAVTEPIPSATTKDELLALLSESTIACVRVNNLDYALTLVDQYLMGISKVPMVATMGVRMGLAQLTQDQNLENVNTSGQFAAALLSIPNPGSETPSMNRVLFIPYKNADLAAKAKTPNSMAISSTVYSLTTFETQNGDPSFPKPDSFSGTSLQPTLMAKQLDETATAPIWAYVNIPRMIEVAGPEAQKKIEEQATTNPQMGMVAAQMVQLEQLGKQYQTVSVSVWPSASMLTLDIDLIPVKGSAFAQKLNKQMFNLEITPDMDATTQGLITLLQGMKIRDLSSVKDESLVGIRNVDQADFVSVFTIPDLLTRLVAFASQMPGQEQNAMGMMMVAGIAQQMGSQLTSKMAMACTANEGSLNIQVAIPKKHLMEMVKVIQTLQQTMQQGQPGNGTGPGIPPPTPAPQPR